LMQSIENDAYGMFTSAFQIDATFLRKFNLDDAF
jgi:hypothetical protein